jgi:hypothetical protein
MATCYKCGCSIPAGGGVRRKVQVGSSSGQTHRVNKYGRRILSGSISSRKYFATRTLCRDCGQNVLGDGSGFGGGIAVAVFVVLAIAFGSRSNDRDTHERSASQDASKTQLATQRTVQPTSIKAPEVSLKFGSAISRNGALSSVGDRFRVGQSIYLSIQTSSSEGGAVDVRWTPLRGDGGGHIEGVRLLSGGVSATVPLYRYGSDAGEYALEVLSSGNVVARGSFSVVDEQVQSHGGAEYEDVSSPLDSDSAVASSSSEQQRGMTAEECKRKQFDSRSSRNFLPNDSREYAEFQRRDLAMIEQCDELERMESRRKGYR